MPLTMFLTNQKKRTIQLPSRGVQRKRPKSKENCLARKKCRNRRSEKVSIQKKVDGEEAGAAHGRRRSQTPREKREKVNRKDGSQTALQQNTQLTP